MARYNAEKIIRAEINAANKYVAKQWAGDETKELRAIFNEHGNPARKMWRTLILMKAEKHRERGREDVAQALSKKAEPFMKIK